MTKFYSRLSYSFGNEDWKTERDALRIKPGDRVMCITASGDRPLHLLMDDCAEVVSVDTNVIQNHLTELKRAAMKELDFDHYLSFLGAGPSLTRDESLEQIGSSMHPIAHQFWLKNKNTVQQGVLYQGALERCLKKVSFFMRFFRGEKIDRLFSFENLEDQRAFVQQHWDRPYFRKVFDFVLNRPIIMRSVLNDPGLYYNLDPTIEIGSYLYERIHNCLNHTLAKENSLLSLFFLGTVKKEAYPPYLTEKGVGLIKKRLDRLHIKTIDVISYLESEPEQSFDCFSLSDVASYLSKKDFERLSRAIYRAAKPGATFSIRQFLSSQEIPHDIAPFFKRDHLLENRLKNEDRCFVYRFMIGNIEKT